MKNNVIKIGALSMLLVGFASCNDKNAEQAEKKVDTYVTYVDSLGKVETMEVKNNWAVIDSKYQAKISEAELAIADVKENEMLKTKLEASKAKYDLLKAQVDEQIAKEKIVVNPNQMLRNRFFGEGKIGEDMNFSWVNKDNILKVYDDFFQSYKDNKSNFSREDYDEVKLMYEALDSRKNTVEKEGLSSEDNNKIASIKFKFAPMFKVNRIGAKARENEAAKE
ncbi:hypothetical protein [Flavobacterium sp.]